MSSSDLRIAISGKSGCGNSTVSRLVADSLGLRVINYTFKDLARDSGMSFEELSRRAETDTRYDLTIDRMQIELARTGGYVLGSRLAIWLLRDMALTVYLSASLEVRAERIARREGGDYAVVLARTAERDARDHDRYARLYGYDVERYEFAQLVVDTEELDQNGVARAIVDFARR
ncbi:MAG TPA: cytidylate kinase family protein [Spirochaetia bacterium]|nr:cytidylate kinase family protein [Spirochaetia bacterium]